MYSSGIRIQVLIDDVSILPRDEVATFLIPPNPICVNQTIPDLNAYCQPSIPGGTFSGPGVSCNSLGVCSFNAALAGVGSHPLFYTYLLSPGCPHVESFTLNVVNSSLSISTTVNSTACFGSCNGSANINIISGASPFTYAWNDNSNQNTNPAINLCAGTYTVSVTDQNNCMATNAVLVNFINIPEVLSNTTIDEECDGTADGSIDLTVSGGTAPYSYNWASTINPNYGTTQDLTNLIPDTYSVTVTDVNGCSATDNIVINIAIPARWPYHPDDGFGLESGTSVAVDEFNFVYATGTFTDHITFDSYQLDAHEFSHYNDVASYIVKLDECGEVKWAKMLYTDLNAIKINKIVVVDAFSFIITGSYWNTADFGNGFSLTSNSNEEWFLAKYTCNSGLPTNNYECQWVVNTGGRDLALDVNNNIYVVGDGITAKYDINGNLLWQNIDPTTTGNAITYCTDCLPGNKILTTGQKNGLVFFNTQDEATGLINPLLSNVFANFPGAGNGIVSHFDNPYNYAYIAGYTANALIKQILLLKIDVSSPLFPVNQYTTGGSSIGIQGDAATDIDINQYNKLFITGHFNSPSITFLGSAPTLINTGLANNNNFVVKYDAHNFSSIWAISSIPTNVDESSMAIVLNNNNDFGYITGGFTGSAQFGIAAALNAISGEDAFIARLQDFSTYGEFRKLAKSSADTVSTKNISVYPNPANDALFIDLNFEEKSFVKLSLFDIFGKQIENPVTGYMKEDRIKMDISRFAAGMYNLKIETNNVTYNYKIIKE
jgi:hypothetical protein